MTKSCGSCIHLQRFAEPWTGLEQHFGVERIGACKKFYVEHSMKTIVVGEGFGSLCAFHTQVDFVAAPEISREARA